MKPSNCKTLQDGKDLKVPFVTKTGNTYTLLNKDYVNKLVQKGKRQYIELYSNVTLRLKNGTLLISAEHFLEITRYVTPDSRKTGVWGDMSNQYTAKTLKESTRLSGEVVTRTTKAWFQKPVEKQYFEGYMYKSFTKHPVLTRDFTIIDKTRNK